MRVIEPDGDEPVRVVLAWLVAAVKGGLQKGGRMSEVWHALRAGERVLARPVHEVGAVEAIEALCVRYGYGVVMELTAALWAQRDPLGALTLGPCAGAPRVDPDDVAEDGTVISLAKRRRLVEDL